MKVLRRDEAREEDATDAPIFVGGKVSRRPLIGGDVSNDYNFNIVRFGAGAKTKLHTHTADQILFVTEGTGIVSTEDERVSVSEGDTIFIPAGERHSHGATPDSDFAHISLQTPASETQIFE